MRRTMIASILLALICGQMTQAKQAKPQPKSRGQNTTAIKVYPARGKRIRIVAGMETRLMTKFVRFHDWSMIEKFLNKDSFSRLRKRNLNKIIDWNRV